MTLLVQVLCQTMVIEKNAALLEVILTKRRVISLSGGEHDFYT